MLLILFPVAVLAAIALAACLMQAAAARERRRAYEALVRETVRRHTAQPFCVISIADAFEPETSILWDTQVPALSLICSAGPGGIAAEELVPAYLSCARSYPELFEGSDFGAWLEFLQQAELIEARASAFAITPAGLEFLKCRVGSREEAWASDPRRTPKGRR